MSSLLRIVCSVVITPSMAFSLSFISLPVELDGASRTVHKVCQDWCVICQIFMLEFQILQELETCDNLCLLDSSISYYCELCKLVTV